MRVPVLQASLDQAATNSPAARKGGKDGSTASALAEAFSRSLAERKEIVANLETDDATALLRDRGDDQRTQGENLPPSARRSRSTTARFAAGHAAFSLDAGALPQAAEERGRIDYATAVGGALPLGSISPIPLANAVAARSAASGQVHSGIPGGLRASDNSPRLQDLLSLKGDAPTAIKVIHQQTHFAPVPTQIEPVSMQRNTEHRGSWAPGAALLADSRRNAPVLRSNHAAAREAFPAAAVSPTRDADVSLTGTAMVGSICGQICDAIAAEASTIQQSRDNASIPPGQIAGDLALPSLRILKLQLAPASLGLVNVVLTNRNDELSIRLEAELTGVAEKLEDERVGLSDRITASGYELVDLVITSTAIREPSSPSGQDEANSPQLRNAETGGASTTPHDQRDDQRSQSEARPPSATPHARETKPTIDVQSSVPAHRADRFLGARMLRSV